LRSQGGDDKEGRS